MSNKSILLKSYFFLKMLKDFNGFQESEPVVNYNLFLSFNRMKVSTKPLNNSAKLSILVRTSMRHTRKSRRKEARKVKRKSLSRNRYSSYTYLKYKMSQTLNSNIPFKKSSTASYHKFLRLQNSESQNEKQDLNEFFTYLKNQGNVNRLLRARLMGNKVKTLKSYYLSDTEFFNANLIKITDKSTYVPQLSTKKKSRGLGYTGFTGNSLHDLLLLRKNDNSFESNTDLQTLVNVENISPTGTVPVAGFFTQSDFRDKLYMVTKNAFLVKSPTLKNFKRVNLKTNIFGQRYKGYR